MKNGNKKPNPAQACTKTILNSAYGKTLINPIDVETKSVLASVRQQFIHDHFHDIKSFTLIHDDVEDGEGEQYCDFKINTNQEYSHFNMCHVGVEVLYMSKRIVNEVMVLAETMENPVKIYYMDTDSMVLRASELPRLLEAHKQKYGENWWVKNYGERYRSVTTTTTTTTTNLPPVPCQLEGTYLGQLHDDFDIVDDDGEKIKCKDVKATRAIFLGKKCYVCHLTGINEKTGAVETCYKVRMKGIPHSTLWYTHDLLKEKGIINDMFDMYKLLYEFKGELNIKEGQKGFDEKKKGLLGINFDLTEKKRKGGAAVRFKFHSDNRIEYLSEFQRFITFDKPREIITQDVIVPSPTRDNVNREQVV